MPLEGVGIKKSYRTERTWQFCAQMGVMHMGADGSMGGWVFLRASFSPAALDLWGVTYFGMHRCHLSRYISLYREGAGKAGPLVWYAPFEHLGCWVQGCIPVLLSWQVWDCSLDLLGCWAHECCGWHMPMPFRQG